MSWNEGYRTDIPYTYGYYAELNPTRIPMLFLLAGIEPPRINLACELGFGQGVGVNMNAAAENVVWYGTDFNPSQVCFARQLGAASGADIHLYDLSFRDFCMRDDLPEFDYIALHGIWSWISDENREHMLALFEKRLRTGGVVYISYNTQPGWAPMCPVRDLIKQYDDFMGARGKSILERVDESLAFMSSLLESKPKFLQDNPMVAKRLEWIGKQNRSYLAHEFFNAVWEPWSFARMARALSEARLEYACSANFGQALAGLGLSDEQQKLLNGIADPMFRECVRDFMFDTQFRKDYWVKGSLRVGAARKARGLRAQTVVLCSRPQDVPREIKGSFGSVTIAEDVHAGLVEVLGDMRVHAVGEMEKALAARNINISQIVQALCIYLERGHVGVTQDRNLAARARPHCEKLNGFAMDIAQDSGDMPWMASPLLGGAVNVSRFEQLFMRAMRLGAKDAAGMAAHVLETLGNANQRMTREGKPIESDEESLAELTSQAQAFLEKRLPVLRALQTF